MTQPTVPGLYVSSPGGVTPATFAYRSLPYTTIYVDPQDESGNASDGNAGTSPSAPIATTAHLNAVNFFGRLTADTLIQYLSDDTSGIGVNIQLLDIGNFTLTVAQTRQVLHTGGTLNAGTVAINPASKQPQIVHTSDLASFAPYVVTQNGGASSFGVRIKDTTTGAGAWIMSAATAAAPKCSRPVLDNGTAAALTIGDPYTLTRGGRLILSFQGPPLGSGGGTVLFQDCAFDTNSAGPGGLNVDYVRCSWTSVLVIPGMMTDCFAQADISEAFPGPLAWLAGAIITGGNTLWSGPFTVTGDTYVTGAGLPIGNGGVTAFEVYNTAGLGPGVQIHDCTGHGLTITSPLAIATNNNAANPLLWGTGNGGLGVAVDAAAGALTVSSGVVPTLTGTAGDFGFFGPGGVGVVTQARAFDETAGGGAGAYTTLRATTWANFAAAIGGGGFGFQAHSVSAGASVVGV